MYKIFVTTYFWNNYANCADCMSSTVLEYDSKENADLAESLLRKGNDTLGISIIKLYN